MMDIAQVTRALKTIKTAGPARAAVAAALVVARQALAQTSAKTTVQQVIGDLLDYQQQLASLPASAPIVLNQRLIERAYIEAAGALGETQVRNSVSLLDEIARSAQQVAQGIGQAAGATARSVGDVAGGVVGGLLSGLGPVVVLVAALVIYARYFRK